MDIIIMLILQKYQNVCNSLHHFFLTIHYNNIVIGVLRRVLISKKHEKF